MRKVFRKMSQDDQNYRHIIAALVTNEPGVLAQVAGMFAARGFNIDSLVVGRTDSLKLSRMTIVVNGNNAVLEQVRKQLQKLIAVVKVVDYKDAAFVERDLVLVQVATANKEKTHRTELIEISQLFRAKVVDVSHDRLMIEMSGTEEKIEAMIEMLRPYGILEVARTGVIAMPRGMNTGRVISQRLVKASQSTNPAIDPSDLPPG